MVVNTVDVVKVRLDDMARRRFGNALRVLRKQKSRESGKVTQKTMADSAGISAGYIAALEAGHRNPPKGEKLIRLAQAYGATADALLRAAQGLESSAAYNPTTELEWAFEAVVSDPKYAFFAEAELPLPAKFTIVQIYELARGKQLLTAEDKTAVAVVLADKVQQSKAGIEVESGLMSFSQPLLSLLEEYNSEDAIPIQKVVEVFLHATRSATDTSRRR